MIKEGIKMEDVRISYEEFGCIVKAWIYLPGRAGVCMGKMGDDEKVMIEMAEAYWRRKDRIEAQAASLIERFPNTGRVIDWEDGKEMFYVIQGEGKKFRVIHKEEVRDGRE